MAKRPRRKTPYQRPFLVRLSEDQLTELKTMKELARARLGEQPSTVSGIVRAAIDDRLKRSQREAEGWAYFEIPPIPHQKLQALVRQGAWTDSSAAVQYAINAYLETLSRSPELPQFEQRFLREKTYSGTAKAKGDPKRGKRK